MNWTQVYDPLGHWWLSTLIAALPIVVLLGMLAGFKIRPHLCAIAGATTSILCAIFVFGMPGRLAVVSFLYGGSFGLLKIVWVVIGAGYLYDISVDTGQFEIMKESVAGITADRRLQVLLVAFCFGAFIEGAAGFGAPVAIAGAFMIGLGFKPFHAAALNLIANTAPVAWGAIGTPVHTLAAVTSLPESDLNAMIGRILPFTAILVPFWLVRAMVSWSETFEVLPAILVVGISFAGMQFFWSNYMDSNLVDIAAGVTSMVAIIVFLRFWKPKRVWRFEDEREIAPAGNTAVASADPVGPLVEDAMGDQWDLRKLQQETPEVRHTGAQVAKAWLPFAILSIFGLLWGLPSVKAAMGRATTPAFKTGGWEVPYLHKAVYRAQPVVAKQTAEDAKFALNLLQVQGTACFLAAVCSGLILGVPFGKMFRIFGQTLYLMIFV